MDTYKIEILIEVDDEIAKECTPYFWCVMKWNNNAWSNVKCGLAETRLASFEKADEAYVDIIKNKKGE